MDEAEKPPLDEQTMQLEAVKSRLEELSDEEDNGTTIFNNTFDALQRHSHMPDELAQQVFMRVISDGAREKLLDGPPDNRTLRGEANALKRGITETVRKHNDPEGYEEGWHEFVDDMHEYIDGLIQAGSVDEKTARLFFESIRNPSFGKLFYMSVISRPGFSSEHISDEMEHDYTEAIEDLSSIYDEEKVYRLDDSWTVFVENGESQNPILYRLYVTADLDGEPSHVLQNFKRALEDTGTQGKFRFKVRDIGIAADNIVMYFREGDDMEQAQALIKRFKELSSPDDLDDHHVPSTLPLSEGLSVAPEPFNLSQLRKLLDLKQVSWSMFVAEATQLASELAYAELTEQGAEEIQATQIKEHGVKYFKQILQCIYMNPDEIIAAEQGKKLLALQDEPAEASKAA